MRVMAQMGMVMNLDKYIGCHTCSVTCKQAWTNRTGVEYVWFNNVETRPGQGYPRTYEDQERWKGGWELLRNGRLGLRTGSRLKRLLTIFSNPRREWKSLTCDLKCSVSWLMRSVRSAICTSGEPVSPCLRWYSVRIRALSAVVTDML